MGDGPLNITESKRLYEEACEYVIGGTTQSKRPNLYIEGEYPIYAAGGEGAYIWDVDGNRFIDWVQALGIVILAIATRRWTKRPSDRSGKVSLFP